MLDEYPGSMMIGEACGRPAERLARHVAPGGMHQVFHFDLLLAPWRVADHRGAISSSPEAAGAGGAVTTWMLSNRDAERRRAAVARMRQDGRP